MSTPHPELEPPTKEALTLTTAMTVADLNAKVREAVLAGNSASAENWAAALRDACVGYRDLVETTEPEDD